MGFARDYLWAKLGGRPPDNYWRKVLRDAGGGETGYVQNGLAAHWDGINNTGNGHDAAADVWKDLAGEADLARRSATDTTWIEDGAVFAGSYYQGFVSAEPMEKTTYATVEIVLKPASSATQYVFGFEKLERLDSNYFNVRCCYICADGTIGVIGKTDYTYTLPVAATEIRKVVIVYDDNDVDYVLVNGERLSRSSKTHAFRAGNGEVPIMLGVAGVAGTSSSYPFYGTIYAIRKYDRKLSASEIAQNDAVDRNRFQDIFE